ncbi:two component transcriptional regulator, LuxR family [Granulicella rosea]|uniref:Two component transcriptional regulator, LuxR family n=1 Tax=Granulicella rosea TaxID=474952 RepID=A0A239ED16_9BACT|nr:response regulator [Granulicella rosea]SNS42536.1 two component transcriptional regulator, LuxR family [Granulicella rosea]
MSDVAPVVFVVDDDISVRQALQNLFRSVGLKVEAFSNAQEFLTCNRPDAPGCLVLDVRLPGPSGIDLQRQLTGSGKQLPIIFITGHGDIRMSVLAMKAGAFEFLTKPFRDQELLDAVQGALERDRGERTSRSEAALARNRYESLTSREQEVFSLVVRGLLNKQVGGELNISEATVKLHRGNLMQRCRRSRLPISSVRQKSWIC